LLKSPDLSRNIDGSPDRKKTLSCMMNVPKVANWKSLKFVVKYCVRGAKTVRQIPCAFKNSYQSKSSLIN